MAWSDFLNKRIDFPPVGRPGLSVIAEGIEEPATIELLRHMGCYEGQGYYFGRPMPPAQFEQTFFTKADVAEAVVAVDEPALVINAGAGASRDS